MTTTSPELPITMHRATRWDGLECSMVMTEDVPAYVRAARADERRKTLQECLAIVEGWTHGEPIAKDIRLLIDEESA